MLLLLLITAGAVTVPLLCWTPVADLRHGPEGPGDREGRKDRLLGKGRRWREQGFPERRLGPGSVLGPVWAPPRSASPGPSVNIPGDTERAELREDEQSAQGHTARGGAAGLCTFSFKKFYFYF